MLLKNQGMKDQTEALTKIKTLIIEIEGIQDLRDIIVMETNNFHSIGTEDQTAFMTESSTKNLKERTLVTMNEQ